MRVETGRDITVGGTLKIQKGFLAVNEFARRLEVDRRSVFRWIRDGKVKTKKFGYWRYVYESEIERILDGR